MKEEFKAYNLPVGTTVMCRVRRCSSSHGHRGAMYGRHHKLHEIRAEVVLGPDGNKELLLDKEDVAELKKPRGRELYSQNVWLDDCDRNEFETITGVLGGLLPTGAEMISRERKRQMTEEGWTSEHDDRHNWGELAINAAICACHGTDAILDCVHDTDFGITEKHGYDGEKPDQLKLLSIAGALIAAEIDRLKRLGLYLRK